MTKRTYPMWEVKVTVTDGEGIKQITVEIDAPDELVAEEDVTAMLYYGDNWEILTVDSVRSIGTSDLS